MASAVVGREGELAVFDAMLETVREVPVAGGLRIWGRSGIGKTSLLDAVRNRAAEREWLVLSTSCHHIQGQMPFVVVKRLSRAAATQLGAETSRYTARLPAGNAPGNDGDDSEEAFYRLLEGLLVDYSVLLVVDDVQWVDEESERVISQAMRMLSDSRLAVATAGRVESTAFAELGLQLVALDRLSDEATAEIVREIVPKAAPDVVSAIVAHAAGMPLTAAVLAKESLGAKAGGAEDVPASMRAVVARSVNQMSASRREFLQLCSLIEDPIEYRVVQNLYGDGDASVEPILRDLIPSFLAFDGLSLRFVHDSIAEGVRQTIPVDVPYRRRVLQALRNVEAPTLGDRERIARQAAACGDRLLERTVLIDLAQHAMIDGARMTACDAFGRALAIEEPATEDYVAEYSAYGGALIACDRYIEAYEVLDGALRAASQRGIREGLGALAASLMVSSWYAERAESHRAIFDRYIALAESSNDRAALLGAVSMFHALNGKREEVRNCKDAVLALPGEVDARWLYRVFQAEALAELRGGNHAAARSALLAASARLNESRPDALFLVETSRLFVDLAEYGVRGITERLPELDAAIPAGHVNSYRLYVEAFGLLAAGKLDDASLFVEQSLMRGMGRQGICRALGIDAAIAVLGNRALQYETLVESEIRMLPGRVGDAAISLATWWAALVVDSRPDEARSVVAAVLPRIREGLNPSVMYLPEPLALYAARARDVALLEEIADRHEAAYATRWDQAHLLLARSIASAALGRPGSRDALLAIADELTALGAHLFASLATETARLSAHGKRRAQPETGASRKGRTSRLTAREVQIVLLVADGLSNRLISEQLVLSERTVEAHVANIFSKVGASSRVQLASLVARGGPL